MNDAQVYISGLGVFFLQVLLDRPVQRFFFPLKVRAQASARLGHRQAVIVFIKNIQFRQRHGFTFLMASGERQRPEENREYSPVADTPGSPIRTNRVNLF